VLLSGQSSSVGSRSSSDSGMSKCMQGLTASCCGIILSWYRWRTNQVLLLCCLDAHCGTWVLLLPQRLTHEAGGIDEWGLSVGCCGWIYVLQHCHSMHNPYIALLPLTQASWCQPLSMTRYCSIMHHMPPCDHHACIDHHTCIDHHVCMYLYGHHVITTCCIYMIISS
jgi:hypothetical protein